MNDDEVSIFLPPGFRFHPSDEELITHYLVPKIEDTTGSFSAVAIGEADMNLSEPWDLPSKAKMADAEEWYFFYERDRKYPTGSRTNRATKSGYWKATGRDKEIYSNNNGTTFIIGLKKTLVFYKGRAPKGARTNWIMHEFRLQHRPNSLYQDDQWVVCRVFNRRDTKKNTLPPPPYSSPLQSDVITPVKSHITGTTQSSSTSCSSYDNYNQYLSPLDYSNVGAYFQDNPTSNTPVFFNDLDEYCDNHHGALPRSVATPGLIPRHCELAADQYGSSLPEQLMGSSSSGSPATTTEYYAGAERHVSPNLPAPTMVDIHSLVNAYNLID